jgi:hypothetical protein
MVKTSNLHDTAGMFLFSTTVDIRYENNDGIGFPPFSRVTFLLNISGMSDQCLVVLVLVLSSSVDNTTVDRSKVVFYVLLSSETDHVVRSILGNRAPLLRYTHFLDTS